MANQHGRKRKCEFDCTQLTKRQRFNTPRQNPFDHLPNELISMILQHVYLTPCRGRKLDQRRNHLLRVLKIYGSLMLLCKQWYSALREDENIFVSNLLVIFDNARIRSPVLTRLRSSRSAPETGKIDVLGMIKTRRKTAQTKKTKKDNDKRQLQAYYNAVEKHYRLLSGHP